MTDKMNDAIEAALAPTDAEVMAALAEFWDYRRKNFGSTPKGQMHAALLAAARVRSASATQPAEPVKVLEALIEFEGYDKHGGTDDTLTAARLLARAVRSAILPPSDTAVAWRVRAKLPGQPWRVVDDLRVIGTNRDLYEVVPLYASPLPAGEDGVRDGWVLVPKEPTPKMYGAGGIEQFKAAVAQTPVREAIGFIYRAMIAAAPPLTASPRSAAVEDAEGLRHARRIALKVGNFGDYRRDELTRDYGQPRYDMMVEIVTAIDAALSPKDTKL